MATFELRLTGYRENVLLEVDTPSLPDLARGLSCSRFLLGRIVGVEGEVQPRGMLIAVSRIEAVLDHE